MLVLCSSSQVERCWGDTEWGSQVLCRVGKIKRRKRVVVRVEKEKKYMEDMFFLVEGINEWECFLSCTIVLN